MKRRIKKVYKRLPPHTNEAHPRANEGEASKPFVIAIITIVAVVALALLLLFSEQLAGRAFFVGADNSAGAVLVAPAYENQPFSLKVQANTGNQETSVVSFTLNLPMQLTCDKVKVQNLLGWDIKVDDKCDSVKKQMVFSYATFGAGKSGTFDVAQIDVEGQLIGDYQFNFESFLAFDNLNKNIIQTILDPLVQVKIKEQVQQAPVCGNNLKEAGETCDGSDLSGLKSCEENKAPAGYVLKCGNDCKGFSCVPVCGNNKVEGNEQCDDGNTMPGDGCSPSCQSEQQPPPQPVCGDGKKEGTEQCDDGNKADNDGCSSLCAKEVQQLPVCGNNKVEGTEKCDDGNVMPGDGCSALCQFEQQSPPPPIQELTVKGTKIILTDVATANNVFSTKVTATESFTNEITIYTVLYGANNKVLSIKSEKVEGGMQKDVTYTATVNYPQANVKSKSVLVFDDKKNPSVYGQLQKPYG